MRQKYEFKSIVAETLLIPLYMRAKESRRNNPILYDKAAEWLADSLEYDYSQFDGAKLSEVGCVVRGWYFDCAVRRFIKAHSHPVVVNVGCGLDTRFQRIGSQWFDVCGTIMSRHGVKPDSLRKHEAQIRSGISNGYVVEQWEPSLKLIEQANYMKFFRSRWGFFFGQILGRIPWLCYKFSSLLGYKITSK